MLHDDAKDGGLDELPIDIAALGDSDKIGPQGDGGDRVELKQPCRQGSALRCRFGVGEGKLAAVAQHVAAGQEFQGIIVG